MSRSRIRLIIAGILVSISMFYLGWQDNQREQNDTNAEQLIRPQADYFIVNSLSKDFNTQGQQEQQLTSPFMEHLPAKQRLEMQHPELIFYKDGQLSSTITSKQGEAPDQDKRIDFIGDVVVKDLKQPEQQRTINTEILTVFSDKKLAKTAAKVTLSDQSGRTTGVGMEADLNANTVELQSQVQGLHYVN